jgi:hypothetical protein
VINVISIGDPAHSSIEPIDSRLAHEAVDSGLRQHGNIREGVKLAQQLQHMVNRKERNKMDILDLQVVAQSVESVKSVEKVYGFVEHSGHQD